jgi:hypothetical protein
VPPLRTPRGWTLPRFASGDAALAAGPVAYTLAIVLLGKVARAAEFATRTGSDAAWPILPLTLGQDLLLVACVGFWAHAVGRLLPRPRVRLWAMFLSCAPIGVLAAADVVAHRLTGTPLTVQRFRGDEGATLADLGLLDRADLAGGIAGIVASFVILGIVVPGARRVPGLVAWSRPRGLLVTAISGLALWFAQGRYLPNAHGLDDQPVFVLIESAFGDDLPVAHAVSDREWERLLRPRTRPAPEPPPPRMGRPARNVVVFLAEGIPTKHTGFAPGAGANNPTPNLSRRWREHGLLFDRYYANWHASIQAIFSFACAAYPPIQGDIVRIKPRIDCGELSEVMRARGLVSGLFHGGAFAFYNKLALLGRRAYSIELDAEELAKTSKRQTNQWGIDDRAMVDATLDWIDTLPKGQRFAAVLIPITAHYPYWVPRDFRWRPKKRGGRADAFRRAVAFQDQVFEELLRGFEKRGLYDDTLFLWLGDHGHAVFEPPRITPGVRGVYQANLHVPLLLVNSKLFPPSLPEKARVSHRLGSHPDLLPTMLDALDVPADPRHQGQSLLSKAYQPRRVYFAAQNGKYLGFVENDTKFIVRTRRGRTEYYDLKTDPDEMTDLSERYAARKVADVEEATRFWGAARARIEGAPVLRERVSVHNLYPLFLRDVEVALVDGQARTPCARASEDDARACPDLGPALREKTSKVQGEKRHCVFVRVPPKGEIELRVDDPDVLGLMHGTIMALPGTPAPKTAFRIRSIVDGEVQGTVRLTRASGARPAHPRARRELRYLVSRASETPADEVCLQLTTLVE